MIKWLEGVQIPKRYADDFRARNAIILRSRVHLFCIAALLIYSLVTLQYVARKIFTGNNTFSPIELVVWAMLIVTAAICVPINRRATNANVSKRIGIIYSVVFLYAMINLAVIYVDSATVFVFYFAFALLLTCLSVPWKIKHIVFLTTLYSISYTLYYMYVSWVMRKGITSFPRFHPYMDGMVFIGIAFFMAVFIRRREIEHDTHNFILLKQLEEKSSQIHEELELATHIHKTLVPRTIYTPRADIAVTYIPAGYVGGDYAKVRFLDDDRLVVFISDVTGHGIPAALLVNRVHAEFERLLKEKEMPGEILRDLNEFICRDFEGTQMYLSAFCGLLDFRQMKFFYSNHGHPAQLLCRPAEKKVIKMSSQGGLLGVPFYEDDPERVYQNELSFVIGDRLLLFTDGLIEAADESGDFYGERRLIEFLGTHQDMPQDELCGRLMSDLDRFRFGPFEDDVFVLHIRTKESLS